MDTKNAITVSDVKKDFYLPHEKSSRSLKSAIISLGRKKNKEATTQHALRGVTFHVKHGEFFGIVGRNGSGKSTLLKILAGIYQPTSGEVTTNGKLVPFIELGVGFNPELSGRENVYLNGALLGFSRKEIDQKYSEIVEFAELEMFMDQKLKNYSSGMQVRLAFAVATHADAEILLVDEVLAVGDADFQRKCFKYFKELKKRKKTVVFVSHDMSAVREYCDRAILIEKNKIIKEGKVGEVASAYTRLFMTDHAHTSDDSPKKKRWGDERIKYTDVVIQDSYTQDNETIELQLPFKVREDVNNPVFGFSVKNSSGTIIAGTNTKIRYVETREYRAGETGSIVIRVPNILNDGEYSIDLAITHDDTITAHDWWEDAAVFSVYREQHTPYAVEPPIQMTVND